MGKLTGRVALITGGARGIGRASALAFAAEGAAVAVADRDADEAARTAKTIDAIGGRCASIAADVTDEDDVARMVAETRERLGGLDILVNNAGIGTSCPAFELDLETWEEMLAANLTSVFLCSRAVMRVMVDQRYGRIINVSSQLALKGGVEMAHYCAAKAGVLGLTKALARELAPYNVTVNAIAPGPVETEMLSVMSPEWLETKRAEIPLGRFSRPEEIAPTALLLASDDGGYYTGSTLNVSGGDVM